MFLMFSKNEDMVKCLGTHRSVPASATTHHFFVYINTIRHASVKLLVVGLLYNLFNTSGKKLTDTNNLIAYVMYLFHT